MLRDASEYHESSHTPDLAQACDTLDEHVAQAVADLWPRKWPADMRPRITRFVVVIVRAVLKQGLAEQGIIDVHRLEGRELLACVVAEIIEAPNARLMARCADFTFELGVQGGLSQTQMAELENVEKATASHYCRTLTETYRKGVPARGMKSQAAVDTYSHLRTGKSSRAPRIEWPFASVFKQVYARAS